MPRRRRRLNSTLAVRWTRLIRRSTQWRGLRPELIQLDRGFDFHCLCCRLFFITRPSAVCRLPSLSGWISTVPYPSRGTSDPRARSASGPRSSNDLLGSSTGHVASSGTAKEHPCVCRSGPVCISRNLADLAGLFIGTSLSFRTGPAELCSLFPAIFKGVKSQDSSTVWARAKHGGPHQPSSVLRTLYKMHPCDQRLCPAVGFRRCNSTLDEVGG